MTHLSRDVLVAWRDHPTEDLRAAVVAHLAVCNACAARYAELVRTRPADQPPQQPDLDAFRVRGLAVRTEPPAVSRVPRWPFLTLAAAALVALAVFVARPRPATAPPPVMRGAASFAAVGPVGPVTDASVFTWRAPAGSSAFRIEILDASGVVVHEAQVRGADRFVLPPEVAAQLRPGVTYHWMVSRLDGRGDVIDSSPIASFTIAR
jgi:hypothetical protein